MSTQKSSLKKLIQKNQFKKSKTNKLLLTDFNKLSLFNNNLKSTKKKLNISNQTYTNNAIKNQKSINTLNNKINNNYYNYNNNKKDIYTEKKGINTSKNKNKITYNNNFNSDETNNFNKQINKSIKCNSVNNLIGININVNYMNKNYSLNKIKPNFYMPNYNNYNSTKNFKKTNCKINNNININDNFYNKFISESFNDINKGNISFHNSSGKNKINKKAKKIIINPLQNECQQIIENLKNKSINNSKIKNNLNNKNKKEKNSFNVIDDKNKNNISYNISKTNFNIQNNILGIGKSFSCKNMNMNFRECQKNKNLWSENKNIYKILIESMDEKINYLKPENDIYDDEKLYEIINKYFIKYCNILEDQSQKELIINIFYLINNIINKKEKDILLLKKEKENLIEQKIKYKKNNEELIEQKKSLIDKNKILQNKLDEFNSKQNKNCNELCKKDKITKITINEGENPSLTSSSYVNTEELESIRFFDKIKMKKHSFYNIPELSFQKIKNDEIKNDILPIKKKNKSKLEKNNLIKKIDKKGNIKIVNKKFLSYNNSNIKSNKKLNISYKQINNSSVNNYKRNIIIVNNNKPNNIGYLFIPDLKK